jgi:hypothetical protein
MVESVWQESGFSCHKFVFTDSLLNKEILKMFRFVFWDVLPCKINAGRQLFYTVVRPRSQNWTPYPPPWELEISHLKMLHFNAVCKDSAAINCINVERRKGSFLSTLTGHGILIRKMLVNRIHAARTRAYVCACVWMCVSVSVFFIISDTLWFHVWCTRPFFWEHL